MYTITIIPAIENLQMGPYWSETFEEVPTKQQLQSLIQDQLAELNEDTEGESDADKLYRGVVCPKILEVLEHGDVLQPQRRAVKVLTVYHDNKRLGSISIQ
jgi:hypothetical protein